jgi:hypothetical protein
VPDLPPDPTPGKDRRLADTPRNRSQQPGAKRPSRTLAAQHRSSAPSLTSADTVAFRRHDGGSALEQLQATTNLSFKWLVRWRRPSGDLVESLTADGVGRTLGGLLVPLVERRRSVMWMWFWIIGLAALVLLVARLVDRHRGSQDEYGSADVPAPKRGTAKSAVTDSNTMWQGPAGG